jgi:3-hydroxybutyryl-CoA dehydratase
MITSFKINQTFEKKFTITSKVYDGFIELFHDKNPLHTNEDFAMQKGFKGRVMHGNILNGFLSFFIGQCLPDENVIIHSQEIQYKNPAYLNDELRFEAQVSEIFESVKVLVFKFTFKNSDLKIIAKGKIQIGII